MERRFEYGSTDTYVHIKRKDGRPRSGLAYFLAPAIACMYIQYDSVFYIGLTSYLTLNIYIKLLF